MAGCAGRPARTAFNVVGCPVVPPAVLEGAVDQGVLVGTLGLTDDKGHPLCAAVRPPLIEWSAAAKG